MVMFLKLIILMKSFQSDNIEIDQFAKRIVLTPDHIIRKKGSQC